MSKIQTIMFLFIFLIAIFSSNMVFGNRIMESFRGGVSTAVVGPGFRPRVVNPIALNRFVNVPRYVIDADDGPLSYRFF